MRCELPLGNLSLMRRNYFGGKHFEAKEGIGIHIEQGPDGGVVTLDDTTIFDAAMRIINEQK